MTRVGTLEPTNARKIAYARHRERRNVDGELTVEHLERVAASVPDEAQTVAYLHDILEHTHASVADLEAEGVTPVELQAVGGRDATSRPAARAPTARRRR